MTYTSNFSITIGSPRNVCVVMDLKLNKHADKSICRQIGNMSHIETID